MGIDFGDVRSALHARDVHRVERFARRGLSPEHWAYVCQSLDRWTTPNRWAIAHDDPRYDAMSLVDALIRYETLLHVRDKAASPKGEALVYRVLRVDQGEGEGYRRVLLVAQIGEALEQWTEALIQEERSLRSVALQNEDPARYALTAMRQSLRAVEQVEAREEIMHTMLGLKLGLRLERHILALLEA